MVDFHETCGVFITHYHKSYFINVCIECIDWLIVCVCVPVECSDNVFTERSGVLSSSDFPNPYPKSSDCLYHIKLEDGFLLSLEFDDTFDIEDHPDVTCPYDYVKVFLFILICIQPLFKGSHIETCLFSKWAQ